MNTSPSPARITRFLGTAVLAGSLFAALTGCAGEDTADAAAPATSSAPATQAPEDKDDLWANYVRVVDGDTIEVQPVDGKGKPTGEPNLEISLLGLKAPEASACGGPESIAYLESELLPEEPLTISFDPALSGAVDQDGNQLAYISKGAGIVWDIGDLVIGEGHAGAWHAEDGPAPEKSAAYEKAQQSASEAGKGLWGACGGLES